MKIPSGKGPEDENFPVGSILIAAPLRPHVARFYAFARAADDIADDCDLPPEEKLRRLAGFEDALMGRTDDPAFAEAAALRESLVATGIGPQHGCDLISAFRQDARQSRYADWESLMGYCERSAAPVGRYLLDLHGEAAAHYPAADALCHALQGDQSSPGLRRRSDDARPLLPADRLAGGGGGGGRGSARPGGDAGPAPRVRPMPRCDAGPSPGGRRPATAAPKSAARLGKRRHPASRAQAGTAPARPRSSRRTGRAAPQRAGAGCARKCRPPAAEPPVTDMLRASLPEPPVPPTEATTARPTVPAGPQPPRGTDSEGQRQSGTSAGSPPVPARRSTGPCGCCRARAGTPSSPSMPSAARSTNIADEPAALPDKRRRLDQWRREVAGLYAGHAGPSPTGRALRPAVARFDLQRADFDTVIDGMQTDAERTIVAPRWTELETYIDAVACAVGRLCVRIFGAPGDDGRRGGRGPGPGAAIDQHPAGPRRGRRTRSALRAGGAAGLARHRGARPGNGPAASRHAGDLPRAGSGGPRLVRPCRSRHGNAARPDRCGRRA